MSLTKASYISITKSLGEILMTGATPHISLFSDSEGTMPLLDASGNVIADKIVAYTNYTQPRYDNSYNILEAGYEFISFTDRTSITITDNKDVIYYNIVAAPFVPE
jgi:hypothetical protein